MYRAHENPYNLEKYLEELKTEYQTAKENGTTEERLIDIAETIAEVKERINHAWSDDEYQGETKMSQYAVGQYFDIFVSTNNYPLWRLFHFMIKAETEITYILQSATMEIEVRKELFPKLIKNGIIEKDCVKFVVLQGETKI